MNLSDRRLSTPGDNRIWLDTVKDCTKEQVIAYLQDKPKGLWVDEYLENNPISLGGHDDETKIMIVKNLAKQCFAWQIVAESLTSKSVMYAVLEENINNGEWNTLVEVARTNFNVPVFLLDYTKQLIQKGKQTESYSSVIRGINECWQIGTPGESDDWSDDYAEEQYTNWLYEFTDDEAFLARLWLRLERHLWLNSIKLSDERLEQIKQTMQRSAGVCLRSDSLENLNAFIHSLVHVQAVDYETLPELEVSL